MKDYYTDNAQRSLNLQYDRQYYSRKRSSNESPYARKKRQNKAKKKRYNQKKTRAQILQQQYMQEQTDLRAFRLDEQNRETKFDLLWACLLGAAGVLLMLVVMMLVTR